MRVRDRYERRGGSMDDVSVPPCLSDDRRSANRVVENRSATGKWALESTC